MQFPLVGPAYQAAARDQDDQALINWYVELDENADAKTPKALLGVPGLSEAVASTFTGEVRGGHVMPGGKVAYLVIGNNVAKLTINTAPTATKTATFVLVQIGSIGSNAGQVCMRDNGVAGICAIVDGIGMYLIKADVVTQCTDPNVINPDRLISIDGILAFNKNGSQQFNTTPIYWNGTDALDGTYFALKDDAPDILVTMIEDKRMLWLVGEATTEVWIIGGTLFQFSRLEGAMLQVGCAAKNSIVRTGHGLMWLGSSERGENFVVQTTGFDFTNVSTPALAYAMTQYPVTHDAFAYTYTEEGHEFYVLTFPTADATWVYDLTTQLWHQRASVDSRGVMHRQRANCLINFAGQRIVGDYQTGQVWTQSRSFYSDGPNPLICTRRTGYVWDGGDRNRVRHSRLQIEFAPGVGLATGQGSDPKIMIRWKDERGWSNEREVAIGKTGEYANRAILRKLTAARSRLYEVKISDPVRRDVIGASLRAQGTMA